MDDALVGHHGLALAVRGPDGQVWFATSGAEFLATLWERRPPNRDAPPPPVVWEHGGKLYRGIVAYTATAIPALPPAQVVVALDIDHHRAFMVAFHGILRQAIVYGIALTGLLGWLAARRGLAPLRHMTAVVHGVSAQQLQERIDLMPLPAELVELASAFNAMLARLEDSFRRLAEFSADIAHELRTPLTNLTIQAQVALAHARSAEEYREVLYSSLEEYDRLARMVADMLFLAKADNRLLVPHRERIDLAAEVCALFDFYEALADDRGIGLAVAGQATVFGDRLMLRRALSNLLSNALRHTPRGATVRIALAPDANGATTVRVENPGAPIPAEHLPHLFERFYRVEPSRTRVSDGAGLGLAITRSIIAAHGGSITVASDAGGTRFELSLP
jgi:two-component system heavy metal sensor histidine kinase CusS